MPEEKTIRALAFLDLQIEESRVEPVFDDALLTLMAQAKEQRLDKLLAKERELGLDEQEKSYCGICWLKFSLYSNR